MRIARASRGYDPRWLWQAPAPSPPPPATLFVRSFERGERVHLRCVPRLHRHDVAALGRTHPDRHDLDDRRSVLIAATAVKPSARLV